jgi:hypothetical protein
MSVSLRHPAVRVLKGKAPVKLRCSGTIANRCVGTLVLRAGGTSQKAVYSIQRGHRATVKVALSPDLLRLLATARADHGVVQAHLIARTAQTSGEPVVLRHTIDLK